MNKWKIIFFLVALLVVLSVFAAEIIYPPVTAPGSGGGNNFNPSQFTTNSSQVTIKNGVLLTNLSVDRITTYSNAIRIGQNAGANFTNTSYPSDFIGTAAGENATNAYNSTFAGYLAGRNAANAFFSIFAGTTAGLNATNAFYSIFIGRNAGYNINQPYRLAIETSSSDRGTNTLIYGEFDNRYLAVNGSMQVSNVMMLRNGAERTNVEPSVTKIYSDTNGELRARRTNDTYRSVYLVNEATNYYWSETISEYGSATNFLTFPSPGTYNVAVAGTAYNTYGSTSNFVASLRLCKNPLLATSEVPYSSVTFDSYDNRQIYIPISLNMIINVGNGETSDFWYLEFFNPNGADCYGAAAFEIRVNLIRLK